MGGCSAYGAEQTILHFPEWRVPNTDQGTCFIIASIHWLMVHCRNMNQYTKQASQYAAFRSKVAEIHVVNARMIVMMRSPLGASSLPSGEKPSYDSFCRVEDRKRQLVEDEDDAMEM